MRWRSTPPRIEKLDHSRYLEKVTKKENLEKAGLLISQYLLPSLGPSLGCSTTPLVPCSTQASNWTLKEVLLGGAGAVSLGPYPTPSASMAWVSRA